MVKKQRNVHFPHEGKWTFPVFCAMINTYGKNIGNMYERILRESKNKEEKQNGKKNENHGW